ncbi:hypothetical protein [Colwellia sp. E2M01]|uniref:hypothetical protein n=1 Tax=Colwellia sp. E2M01 TaxID=2841561 RepID=UPI001C088D06|nr:hypothetical protein [Colwellia sp. E2M01]MBU2869864.1 hypothetical protein [Colwellia sp. E2M01]
MSINISANISTNTNFSTSTDAIEFLLKKAKKIHRQAQSTSAVNSLPILRRLISNNVLSNISLVALNKQKALVQRKHILQLFAFEAGFNEWGKYRQFLATENNWQSDNYLLALTHNSYPNLWFSTLAQAVEYAKENGGKALKIGTQAMVVVE